MGPPDEYLREASSDEVTRLRAELEAARRTIAALLRRQELAQEQEHALQHFAVHKAMANLEGIIEQRTHDLLQSEARYRALYDHSPDMLFTVDTGGTITAANLTSASRLGCTPDDLRGRALADLFDETSAPHVRRLVEDGFRASLTEDEVLADGRVVNLSAAPLPGFGGHQVVLRDVTSRRALEAELHHTRRLAAIGHLAAGVAHEINNPLAVIHGRLELLELNEALPADTRRDLAVVGEHVQRIARIVRNLQTFARRGKPEREAVELVGVIGTARELAAPRLQQVRVEIDVLPRDLALLGDRGQMEQVLVNLFTNAADAMGGEGTVLVRGRLEGELVRVEVEDEGPGIPPALAEEIFTPFVTGKAPTKGTGLGLAIVWGIVREHGGAIRAYDAPTGGAGFSFTIPQAKGPAAPRAPAAGPSAPTRSLSVLCVEDEASLLTTLTSLIRAAGHTVTGASTAEEALERVASEGPFDVLLTDIRLPGMSGIDFREALAARDPAMAARMVVMSGLFHEPAPGTIYVQKPFTRAELLEALEAAARLSP